MAHYIIREIDEQPTDFVVRRIGDNILVSLDPVDLTDQATLKAIAENPQADKFFAKIINAKWMRPFGRYVPSANLPSADSSVDLKNITTPDWKEWLKAPTDQLYDVLIRFKASHYTEWEVWMPQALQVGGIKSSQAVDKNYTEDDIVHLVTNKDYYPSFKLWNYSQYTLVAARAYIRLGRKYLLKKISTGQVPEIFDTVILRDVTEQ